MNYSTGSTMPQFPNAIVIVVLIAVGFILLAILLPRWTLRVFHAIESFFSRFAKRKTVAILALFFAVIGVRLAALPQLPVPVPGIHDEFSYLLVADTFAHGRVANLPHPMWMSFESFHVNWFPTYSSKYPPGQGTVLAVGQLLGHPWIGVLLSAAAMCAAILWMLQAWLPARWALLGGVLVLLRFGLFSYWMNSYWGGAVAATGGALVIGALPRIYEHRRPRDAVVFGLGSGILATSRPFEGCIFCIPLMAALVWWALRRETPERASYTKRVLSPIAAILVCIVGFVGYYNWRVTRSPAVFPHFIEQRMYFTTAVFLWQHEKQPRTYANPQFDDFTTISCP